METRMYVEYVNARVHGMSSRLITTHGFERLIAQPSLEGIITELEKTPYREEIVEARILHTGISCIEYALRKNLMNTYRKILALVEGEKPARYIIIFLKKWDVQNIKTIIRGKNIQTSNEEISGCLIPAGTLDETTLIELIKQPDVRAVVDMMATWEIEYAVPLTRHIGEFSQRNEIGRLEYALDEYYFESSLRQLSGKRHDDKVVRDLIGTEIDIRNIKTAMMMIRDSVSADEAAPFLLSGGKEINNELIHAMIGTKKIPDALRLLEQTSYRFLLSVPDIEISQGKISVLEKELDRFLIRNGIAMFRGDPLSFTIVIGYLWAKLNEITNIRVIARCRETGMPDELMESEIFYV
ncbi:MAG: V-type ATPase subunit [Methanoregulaceae archaeon]|jgi:V/A-type H+-transporting ATPase subunit C|nr:V-type ATPase subunit [Methanoregulaceae archaeon]